MEDDALRAELSALDEVRDAAQIEDRFYRDAPRFSTGGLRACRRVMNRMNVYVVRRATQGLAAYLKAAGLPLRCAIAYDSRIGSARFARETARVLAANGVTAYLYPRLEPTPALSWAVLTDVGGVCVGGEPQPRRLQRLQGLRSRRLPDHARGGGCRIEAHRGRGSF